MHDATELKEALCEIGRRIYEHGYVAADFFTCGAADPARATGLLVQAFRAERVETLRVLRGQLGRDRLVELAQQKRNA